jgi:NTE family protein
MLRKLPRPAETLGDLHRRVEESGAQFDGRLRIAAVESRTGRRVLFGAPGSPAASVADAVTASCTVPWLFAPVEIDGREYVDGGVWSPTNLDAAPAGRSTHVLCLIPTASVLGSDGFITVVRRVTRSASALEALALRRRGADVALLAPNAESAERMGSNLMDGRRSERVLAAGYRQGRRFASGD